jgi:hypothetical protein
MALSRSMKNLMHDSAMARKGGGTHNPNGGGRSGMIGRALQKARGQYNPGGNRGGNRGPVLSELPTTQSRFGKGMQKAGQRGGIAGMIRGAGGRNPRTGGPGLPTSAGGGFLGKRNATSGGVSLPPRAGRASGMQQQQAMVKAKMQQQQQRGAGGGMMGRPAVQPIQRGPGTMAGKPMPGGGSFGFASRGGGGTPALQQATAGARMQQQAATARMPGATSAAAQSARFRAARPGITTAPGGALGGAAARPPAALAKPRGQSIASRIGGQQGPPARRGGMARALGSGGSRRRMLR